MASGGSDRQTGTVPKTKARNNCNVPQEVVTPTRRDIHSTNIMTVSILNKMEFTRKIGQ